MTRDTLRSLREKLERDGAVPSAGSAGCAAFGDSGATGAPGGSGASVSPRRGGIGLRNVHERFKLMFGAGYELTVESERGGGTRIRIRLPIVRDQDEGLEGKERRPA